MSSPPRTSAEQPPPRSTPPEPPPTLLPVPPDTPHTLHRNSHPSSANHSCTQRNPHDGSYGSTRNCRRATQPPHAALPSIPSRPHPACPPHRSPRALAREDTESPETAHPWSPCRYGIFRRPAPSPEPCLAPAPESPSRPSPVRHLPSLPAPHASSP